MLYELSWADCTRSSELEQLVYTREDFTQNSMPTTHRETKKSVTCFLQCGDEYLFVHRNSNLAVDAGLLNGVGGKLEPGEDYLSAALREIQEETGYRVEPSDCSLRAVAVLEGGYPQDWVMCFFAVQVESKVIPRGLSNAEGQLLWLHKSQVLSSGFELVDDLNYCWPRIVDERDGIFFFAARANVQEKLEYFRMEKLPL